MRAQISDKYLQGMLKKATMRAQVVAHRIAAGTNHGVIASFPQPSPNTVRLPKTNILWMELRVRELAGSS